MRQKRRVAITVETTRLLVRRSISQVHAWCVRCSAYVQAVTPEEAAALLASSTCEIYTQTEAGEYHLVEDAESFQICLNSLFGPLDKQNHN